MVRFCRPPCPHSIVLARASAAQGPKRLISKRNQTILPIGKPVGECQMKSGKILFVSKEDAEAETGYFFIFSIVISWELARKISTFIQEKKIMTFSQPNQAKTCHNTYTLNFTLKHYHDPVKRRAYLSKPGASGINKHSFSIRDNRNKLPQNSVYANAKFTRLEELEGRTPSLEQMFFWSAQKYPDDILWVDYSNIKPLRTPRSTDDDLLF